MSRSLLSLKHIAWLTCAAAAVCAPLVAQASPPKDKVTCTDAPTSTWLTEEQARQRFGADRYVLVRFKISRGNCHEFYAIDHQGGVMEAYVHPVTGEVIKSTYLPRPDAVKP